MNVTRKQALSILGTWLICARGVWSKEGEALNKNALSLFAPVDTVTFRLDQYKKMVVEYGGERVELTTKEVFEALKGSK